MRTALFPGSFDPLTLGHVALVHRALALFDGVCIAIGDNPNKRRVIPLDTRVSVLRETFAKEPRVTVAIYEGLTITFAQSMAACAIVRGLRDPADFGFEMPIAQANRAMAPTIETVFLPGDPNLSFVSSSLMREIGNSGGDPSPWLPSAATTALARALGKSFG